MSTVTSREKNMLLVAVVAVLYAVAALSYKKQITSWKAAERLYQSAQKKVQEERALIEARSEWTAKYEQMRDLMPIFPYDQNVDTHWMNIMDAAAARNGLNILRRQASKEAEVGDVYELPIECKDWEGTLEALVKFLYDLHKEGAMLDVRQLFIRPANSPGVLKGAFTLYCAYMRGDEAKKEHAPPAEPSAAGAGEEAGGSGPPQSEGAPDPAEPGAVVAPAAGALPAEAAAAPMEPPLEAGQTPE